MKLSNLKNLLWAAGILLCLMAMLIGLIFAMSQKNTAARESGTLNLNSIERADRGRSDGTEVLAGLETQQFALCCAFSTRQNDSTNRI